MNRIRALAAPALLALAGCLSHMAPDRDPVHLGIEWVDDFHTARGIAAESARPILLVMAAGDIRERC